MIEKFDHIVVAIEQSRDTSSMKLDELQSALEAQEQRLTERDTAKVVAEKALLVKSEMKGGENQKWQKERGRGGFRRGRGRSDNPGRGYGGRNNYENKNSGEGSSQRGRGGYSGRGRGGGRKNFDKSRIQCHNCNKYGHFQDECWSKPAGDEVKLAHEESDKEETLLMVTTKDDGDDYEDWHLDTGCSTHMSGRKDWFVNIDYTVKSKVRFADDRTMKVEGVGRVKIRRKDGNHILITGVLYVPGMKTNLLSVGQLLEKGYRMVMKEGVMKVYDPKEQLLVKATLSTNRTFKVNLNVVKQECLATVTESEEWLWHHRFAHLNFKDLSLLQRKSMVTGLPHVHLPSGVCEECMEGKMTRSSFNQQVPTRSEKKLQVIFSDVCGPIQHETLGGNRYFVTFIDECTRKLWIYLIKRKSDVFEVFKKFKVLVENQCGEQIKILRSDGGGEYVSGEFHRFLESEGITHEVTPPYTPQHNGTAERKNRTLMNMVRSMLKTKKMPKHFWGEAVSTAAYVLNRCPSKRLSEMTPEEAWSGIKPDVSHFKVFGSVCHKHIPDSLRSKLDDKSEVMVLLGYHSTGGYKLLNPATNQVVISRDVLVDESKNWNWETAVSEASRNSILLNSDDPESRNSDESESELQGNGEEGNVRRSSRTRQLPQRLSSYEMASDNAVNSEGDLVHFALLAEAEPVTVEEALESPKWIEAMEDELNSIEKNNTWELVSLPGGKKSIGVKWVYKVKVNPIGEIIKYKARLVVRGFLQKHGVDYDEVFAPVARLETVRTVVAYASVKNWSMHQLDVKSAFLNGDLEEEVYVDQPPGFARKKSEGKVFKLRKALYGLKQAPRAWNKKIDGSLQKMGFTKCVSEHGVYVKTDKNDSVVIVCLYVDDLLVTGNEEGKITEFKQLMMREFDMTDLGHLSYFLGIEFRKTKGGLVMCQEKYARDLLDRVGMLSCNPVETPAEAGICLMREGSEESVDSTYFRQIVGGLRYLCNTRPDLAYSVGLISRFMDKPRVPHLMAAKRILRYVKGTIEFGLLYPNEFDESDLLLSGYTDADWCGDKNDRKSTAGYAFMVGNSPVSWQSKKETVVALSSCEAEYIAASMSACQAVWLDTLMQELKMKQADPVELFIDNKSAINLAKFPVAHGRCKHIETRFHYLRDQVGSGRLKLTYCKTEQQVADIFTKALRGDNFKKLKKMLNVVNTRELA